MIQHEQQQGVVLDTSVFVAALLRPNELQDASREEIERQHIKAQPYISGLESGDYIAYLPRLCVVETCAVVRRRVKEHSEARSLVIKRIFEDWSKNGQLVLYDMDQDFMDLAVSSAIRNGTRGADSVFVALSEKLAFSLKTFDKDIIEKYEAADEP